MLNFDGCRVTRLEGSTYQVLRANDRPWAMLIGPRGATTPVEPETRSSLVWVPRRRVGSGICWLAPYGRSRLRRMALDEVERRRRALARGPTVAGVVMQADATGDLDVIQRALRGVEATDVVPLIDGLTDLDLGG